MNFSSIITFSNFDTKSLLLQFYFRDSTCSRRQKKFKRTVEEKRGEKFFPSIFLSFRSQHDFRSSNFFASRAKEYAHVRMAIDIPTHKCERDSKFEREKKRERGEKRCISKVGATRQRSGCINTRRSNQLASRRACSRNKHLKVIPDDLKQRLRPRVR